MKDHPDINVVEMDCVEGKKGESRGIGQYMGIKTLEVRGAKKDYLYKKIKILEA